MAKCKYCGRAGWFLKVTANGLCKACDPNITQDILKRSRTLNYFLRTAEQSSVWSSKVECYGTVLEHAEVLARYEERGIPTIEPLPSALLRDYKVKIDTTVRKGLEAEIEEVQEQIRTDKNIKAITERLGLLLGEIRKFQSLVAKPDLLDDLEKKLEILDQQIEYRPLISTYVGQEVIKHELRTHLEFATRQSRRIPHILFCGPPEMGKVTLANAIANEMHKGIKFVHAVEIERPPDLADLLANLEEGDFLGIEQIESLREQVLKSLIAAIEDLTNDSMVDQRQSARTRVPLKGFTLVGTTSKPSQVDKRVRRWMISYDFVPYNATEISEILQLLAEQRKLTIDPQAALVLAEHCQGCPGNAGVMVKRIHDYLRALRKDQLTLDLANDALTSLGYVGRASGSTNLVSKLSSMEALEFEEYVANLFRDLGYKVETTQGSGDHGIDLLMRKDNKVIVVQCKRWNDPVGEPVIRDFYGSLMGARAQSGYIVTTSTFTSQAYSFVQGKPIQLVDLDTLINLATTSR